MSAVTTGTTARFPDEAPIMVRYPRTAQEAQGDRESWPWLPGSIVEQVGPDEWTVCVEAVELAEDEDGVVTFPVCFRDASEIRPLIGQTFENV